jgi:hypothetical protein
LPVARDLNSLAWIPLELGQAEAARPLQARAAAIDKAGRSAQSRLSGGKADR